MQERPYATSVKSLVTLQPRRMLHAHLLKGASRKATNLEFLQVI